MNELWKKINSDTRSAAVFYGVIASLLASAVIKYSPFALTITGQYTLGALTNFIDSRYAKAATLEHTNYSYFLLTVIFAVIVIAWMEISSKIKKNLKKSTDSAASEVEESFDKPNPETPKWVPKAFLVARIIIWLHLSWGLLYVAGEATVLNAITDFKQHVRIVTPYIEPKEKDLLISDWSQMRELADYNNIYKRLAEIAKENDLKLYKNKQY